MLDTNVVRGFSMTIILLLTGRVIFVKNEVGKEIFERDQVFKVFRRVVIKPFNGKKEPQALFKIVFKPANMGIEENKRFSKLPMMIFMGFKGFRSKYWAVNEGTGLCIGIYEWDTIEDAENYAKSIAVTFMSKRSVPGTVEFEIIPIISSNTPDDKIGSLR